MFPITYLVLSLVAVSHQLSITKFEVPGLVEVGGTAELTCEHDIPVPPGYVKWWWTPPGSIKKLLYQRIDGKQKIVHLPIDRPFNATLKTPDLDTLVLWDLQPEHTGAFACEVVETTKTNFIERSNSTTLVVYTLGSGVQLNTTKFEDANMVQVTCEAVGVAPKPNINMSVLGHSFNKSVLHGPENGLYNVFTNATFLEDDLEDQEITCKIFFEDYDIEIPTDLQVHSETYHSDAWLTTTEAPEEAAPATLEATALHAWLTTTEAPEEAAPATLEATALPGSSSHIRSSRLLFPALLISTMLRTLL